MFFVGWLMSYSYILAQASLRVNGGLGITLCPPSPDCFLWNLLASFWR